MYLAASCSSGGVVYNTCDHWIPKAHAAPAMNNSDNPPVLANSRDSWPQ